LRTRVAEGNGSWTTSCAAAVLFRCFYDFVVEKIESSTENNPFNAIFVSFTQGLPYSLFLRSFACAADSGAAAVGSRWVLLDLAELNALGRDIMASICKVKHAPEGGVWVRF